MCVSTKEVQVSDNDIVVWKVVRVDEKGRLRNPFRNLSGRDVSCDEDGDLKLGSFINTICNSPAKRFDKGKGYTCFLSRSSCFRFKRICKRVYSKVNFKVLKMKIPKGSNYGVGRIPYDPDFSYFGEGMKAVRTELICRF